MVGIGGGIAAFKAVEVIRELGRQGAQVRVVMTTAAQHFLGGTTLAGLTGEPVITTLWDPAYPGEVHVALSDWADAILVVPATHNLLARVCTGMADDPLLATISCARGPVFFAPAMHTRMWGSPANQRNVNTLAQDGYHLLGPVSGPLASGAVGMGRLMDPQHIVAAVAQRLQQPQDLQGRTVLVSAGPTQEDLDPVRYISNRSTGRMGFAIAEAAMARGAHVVLVVGPTTLPPPAGAEVIAVRSALQMHETIMTQVNRACAVVMTAAVADYRPQMVAERKIKKQGEHMQIELVKNPDILKDLGTRRTGDQPVLVGFAMETQDVITYARKKLVAKGVDLIVGNEAAVGFGGTENEAVFVSHEGDEPLPRMSKLALGHRIWDRVLTWL